MIELRVNKFSVFKAMLPELVRDAKLNEDNFKTSTIFLTVKEPMEGGDLYIDSIVIVLNKGKAMLWNFVDLFGYVDNETWMQLFFGVKSGDVEIQDLRYLGREDERNVDKGERQGRLVQPR